MTTTDRATLKFIIKVSQELTGRSRGFAAKAASVQ